MSKTVDALDFHWSCASLVLAVVSMVSSQSVMLSPSGEGTRSAASRPKTVGQAPDTQDIVCRSLNSLARKRGGYGLVAALRSLSRCAICAGS